MQQDTSPTTSARLRLLTATFITVGLQAGCGGGGDDTPPAPAPAPIPATAAEACSALNGFTIAPADITFPTSGATVTATTLVAPSGTGATAVGEYCKATGTIQPVDRAAPPIRFDIALPTTWNNKAMHLMGGGYDGSVVAGSGSVPGASGLATPVARGYAGFGSDSGHAGSALEASFALNAEALENYLGDQLRKTRDVAMKVIARRYGTAPTKTYSAGGSGGGREALYVADRWPTLYDGVIAYYPAWSLTAMLTNYTVISRKLAAPGAWSTPAKQQLLAASVVSACDALDGAVDGMVSNVAACTFDPQTIRCAGGADTGDTCLSDAQITGFTAYAAPLSFPYTLANGTNSYAAFNIFNAGTVPSDGTVAPANPSTFAMPFATAIGDSFARFWIYGDPSFNALTFDLNANGYVQQREQYISSRQDINPNLSAFAAKGGKIIIVHGQADPLIPSGSSDELYTRATASMGVPLTTSFIKYFRVPGYGHGSGAFNVSYDSITALEKWVESSTAPTAQVARDANAATSTRTRPLCEFPAWPRYNGTGDINLAASFSCTP